MTVQNPPTYIQAGTHPAEGVRRAHEVLAGVGLEGVADTGDMLVSESGTPAMSVSVAEGRAVILGDESSYQGSYIVDNQGATTVTISAADGSNPRIDIIVAQVEDSAYSGATDAWSLAAVDGTPAGSPSAPATPSNAIKLAEVAVAAGATTIVNANITDTRPSLGTAYRVGGTDVAITDGGTGASSASAARTNLGLVIGTNVQAWSAVLDATTASFTVADETKLDAAYSSGGTDVAVADGGTGASSASGARTNLGLVIGTDVQDVDITDSSSVVTATTVDGAFQEIFKGQGPVNTVGTSGSTETLTLVPYHKVTMDQNCTFTFPTPATNGHTFVLYLSGAFTPTWPASVDWGDATAPTYATPSVFTFSTVDGGTTWLGVMVGSGYG